jgi:hypothetical protein
MDIKALKSKPLWQMTGEEFLYLQQNSSEQPERQPYVVAPQRKHVYGIAGSPNCSDVAYQRPTASRKAERSTKPLRK